MEECRTAEDLVARIGRTEMALSRLCDSWESPKRPEEWSLVYEGLRILEAGCVKAGLPWRVPSIEEFYRDVVSEVESSTWSIKRTAAERFVSWFVNYLVDHTFTGEHGGGVKGEGEIFLADTIEADGAEIEGYWVTENVLDKYNSQADDSDKIPSLRELCMQSADLLGIPHALVLDSDGKHSRNMKFGRKTKRVAFVSDVSPRQSTLEGIAPSEKDGNPVTKAGPDPSDGPGSATGGPVTQSPSYQAREHAGNRQPDDRKDGDVTRLPRKSLSTDDDADAEGGSL
jgi:hypothetical protein